MFSSRFKWKLTANRLSLLLEDKRRAGDKILDLTQSNPTRARLNYSADAILAALANPSAMRYEPTAQGLLIAREAVSVYYSERGCTVEPERIYLTASTSEAYSYLFKLLTDPGQNVLVPQPSYPLFEFLAALEGALLRAYRLVYSQTSGWQIDFESLQEAITSDTRAIIIVNPNNPTGSFIKRGEMERLLELCARHNLALIVDEVFSDYAFADDPSRARLPATDAEILTFVLSGLSKVLALPQMKLGWIVVSGPEPLRNRAQQLLELIADTFLSVNTPTQHAAPAWLRRRTEIQQQILDRVLSNYALLDRLTSGTACRLLKTEGGWYAIIEAPRLSSEEELILTLLDRDNVLVHPGYFFDFPREAFLVISLLPPSDIFSEGVSRMLARALGSRTQ